MVNPTEYVQIGWMLGEALATEMGITPFSDDYLFTMEQAEADGGIKPEYMDRMVPIYRRLSRD